jgi:cholesterol transport system auxiliary component
MKPSQIQLVMQVMLIHSIDSRVVAADTIYESIPCPKDTPLGGVLAANGATRQLTSRVAHFVVEHVKRDQASM